MFSAAVTPSHTRTTVRLLPREEEFFDLFVEVATRNKVAAQHLRDLFDAPPDRRIAHVDAIKRLEHEADQVTHEVVNRLDRTFITPLDREDIHQLASNLDDVMDAIDGTARRSQIFHLGSAPQGVKQLAEVIQRMVGVLGEAVGRLKKGDDVMKYCIEAKKLEEEGDAIYQQALGLLFETERDPLDVINGFHDSANSIATIVSTRVLSPGMAVIWAAFFNFVAAFGLGTAVAKTIGKGLIDLSVVEPIVILGGLIGAIVWDLITWWGGLPTSSSHALIGGYAGAAVAKAGFAAIIAQGWIKTLVFIVVAPLMGLTIALGLTVALSWALRRSLPRKVDRVFRSLQLLSAALYSLGHGTNDAQKTMGIIVGLLFAARASFVDFPIRALHLTTADVIPIWVILSAHAAIALGTLAGGWRIVKTMGQRITKLTPFGGFCAETSGAITLFVASHFGIPVSTTHTITGAISGVGAAHRLSAVRWGVAGRIGRGWVEVTFFKSIIGTPSTYSVTGAWVTFTRVSMLCWMRRAIARMFCRDCLSSGCVSTASCSSSCPSARMAASALFTSWSIVTASCLITATRSPSIARP